MVSKIVGLDCSPKVTALMIGCWSRDIWASALYEMGQGKLMGSIRCTRIPFILVTTSQSHLSPLSKSYSTNPPVDLKTHFGTGTIDQPPVLAVLGSVLVPLLHAFSGTGLRTRFVPLDLFRTFECRIGPIPTCPLFLHFRSPSGTIPVGTTYTTTKPPDIDTLAHPKLPSTRSPLQP